MLHRTSYTIQPSTEAERNLFRLQVQYDHTHGIYSHQTKPTIYQVCTLSIFCMLLFTG